MGTALGSIITLLIGLILIFYGAIKITSLVSFGESDVMQSSRDSYYDMTFLFPDDLDADQQSTLSPKFDFAFGLTGVDGEYLDSVDPRYGKLKARYV